MENEEFVEQPDIATAENSFVPEASAGVGDAMNEDEDVDVANEQDDDDGDSEVEEENAFERYLTKTTLFSKRRECVDFEKFLDKVLKKRLVNEIRKRVLRDRGVKIQVVPTVEYVKVKPDANSDDKPIVAHLRTRLRAVYNQHVIVSIVKALLSQIREKHCNFIRESSGLRINAIREVKLFSAKFSPITGRAFVELPMFLLAKKAIVNVQNKDTRCFGYALLSALHPQECHSTRPQKYNAFFAEHQLDTLDYPVRVDQLEEIEAKLGIPFNVFSFFDDEGKGRYPLYLSRFSPEDAIDLLYWDEHYAWIKSFSRFMADATAHRGRLWYCKRCLGHFSAERILNEHLEYCCGEEGCKVVYKMPEVGTIIEFKNVRAQQRIPFIIYADFECLTGEPQQQQQQDDEQQEKAQRNVAHDHGDYCRQPKRRMLANQHHVPISVGLKLVSDVGLDRNGQDVFTEIPYETYTGADVCDWFLKRVLVYEAQCLEYLFDEKRLVMTADDQRAHDAAWECCICHDRFQYTNIQQLGATKGQMKVRDHDHITGKYRGAAHSSCNLKLRRTYKIPVIFHNFRGYDSHLIVRALGLFKDIELTVIGQTLEKYLTIGWGTHLVFKDSLQFLACSLERLVECLLRAGRDKFVQLRREFPALNDTDFAVLMRKGIYPYDYMNSAERLEESRLPARECFANRLRQEECSTADYEHAVNVWRTFGCNKFLDYHNLYLKCDVLLLADIFESFRTISMQNYELDPAHFVSAPHLSWEAMLKMTKCKQELLTDAAMFTLLHEGLRGGVSMISKRHAKANNKYMGSLYDASQPSSYIIYLDANNLYGWAMSESLPTGEFKWLGEEEFSAINWLTQKDDQDIGYFVECDLDYPKELHDLHNDYPLAAERLAIADELLSETQRDVRDKYEMLHTATTKLVPNLMNKTNYTCHYRNLRFYLEHGLVLGKVHKVIQFRQSKWLAPYIAKNSTLRAATSNAFEKDFFKLLNNSVYGKTCENLTKRNDIRLVTDQKKCKKLIEKPHCLAFEIFSEHIAAVELQKIRCEINKPTYVGFTVLELSKLLMYGFHYDFVLPRYKNGEAKLLLTDTDSLIYHIETNDLYDDLAKYPQHFDFSNYPPEHQLHSDANKMVIGKMKDEAGGKIITELVGLRPKMYSYLTLVSDEGPKYKEAKRAKGIQRVATEKLRHEQYLAQLHEPVENYVCVRRIGQKHHLMYTLEGDKRALCAFDDKRYLLPDGVSTLAHGHYSIVHDHDDAATNFLDEAAASNSNNQRRRTATAAFRATAATSSRQTTTTSRRVVTDADGDQSIVVDHEEGMQLELFASHANKRRRLTHAKLDKFIDQQVGLQDPGVALKTVLLRLAMRRAQPVPPIRESRHCPANAFEAHADVLSCRLPTSDYY